MANILEILAQAVGFDKVRSELEDTAANTRAATTGMSDAFKALAGESEAATTQISSAFVQAAEASVAMARARDQVRIASREAKSATDDDTAAIERLAVAQRNAAVVSEEMAIAQKAAAEALIQEAAEAEAAAGANLGFFGRLALAAKESSLSVRESMREMSASLVESAEAAKLSGAGMTSVLSGFSKLLGAGIAVGFAAHFADEFAKGEVELGHLSEATGIAAAKLAALQAAMTESGVGTENFSTMITRLSRSIDQAAAGTPKMQEAFRQLGVDTSSWADKFPGADQVLMQLADHFHESSGATQDLGNASQVLGRNIIELKAFLGQGSEAIAEQVEKYRELGQAKAQAIQSARDLIRSNAELKASWQLLIAEAFPPLVTGLKYIIAAFHALRDDIAFATDMYLGSPLLMKPLAQA